MCLKFKEDYATTLLALAGEELNKNLKECFDTIFKDFSNESDIENRESGSVVKAQV